MLALPGSAYLYQGEELGLPDAALPDDALRDPTWERSAHSVRGRDGCRVPMPWEGSAPSYGFGPGGSSWLPQPAEYGALAVDQQEGVTGSTLDLYRTLLRLRREHRLGAATLVLERRSSRRRPRVPSRSCGGHRQPRHRRRTSPRRRHRSRLKPTRTGWHLHRLRRGGLAHPLIASGCAPWAPGLRSKMPL